MAYMINRDAPQSGLANLLALRGRQGDTELVHMSKPEIAALQSMGQMTVNPATGLPEAFKLKDILPSLAVIAGNVMTGGGLSALQAAMVAGGTSLIANKGDLGKAAMDALMGFGGAQLGKMIGAAGGAGEIGKQIAQDTAGKALTQTAGTTAADAATNLAIRGIPTAATDAATMGLSQASPYVSGLASSATAPATSFAGELGKGFGKDLGKSLVEQAYQPSLLSRGAEAIGLGKQFIPKAVEQSFGKSAVELGTKDALIRGGLQAGLPLASGLATQKPEEPDRGTKYELVESREEEIVPLKPKYTQQDIEEAFIQDQYGTPISPLKFFEYRSKPAVFRTVPRKEGGGVGMEDATRYHGPGMASGMVKDSGRGDGMSDNVMYQVVGGGPVNKAALSPDEYIMDAHTVAALGNGSSDAGAKILDEFRETVRKKAYGNTQQPKQIDARKIIKQYA